MRQVGFGGGFTGWDRILRSLSAELDFHHFRAEGDIAGYPLRVEQAIARSKGHQGY
jgi:hypothetical protein